MGHGASLPKIIYQDLRKHLQKFWRPLIVILILLVIYLIYRLFVFQTGATYYYLYEDMLRSETKVYDKPGIYFKIPFASRVTRYDKVWTVSFGGTFTGEQILKKGPIELRFADSYMAKVPVTFRYKKSTDRGDIKRIHEDFSNQHNLVDSLLIPISENAMVSTATQYTGEEFSLSRFNSFQMDLLDQLQKGIYQTERKQVPVPQDLAKPQADSTQPTPLMEWKRVPIRDKDGKIPRLPNPLEEYGIEVTQVTLRKPVSGPELKKLLDDNKRLDREAMEAKNKVALIQEQTKTDLANVEKEQKIQRANVEKAQEIQLANVEKDKNFQLANKAKEFVLVEEVKKIQLANVEKDKETQLARIEKEKEMALARKTEELALVAEEEKIQLANVEKDKKTQLAQIEKEEKMKLAKKAEELALVEEEEKVQLANVEKDKKTQLALIEKEEKMKLAKKAEELALVEEEAKIQLANVEKDKNTQLANKAKELVLVEEEKNLQLANVEKAQKIQLANVEKDKNTQLANKAKELVLVKESEKIQLAKKAEELAIVEAETKIQLAKKTEELAIAQEEQKIQKANFEVAQFEAKVLREKGLAEADVLKAMYQARIPEMYLAEIQLEIANVIYPNLKGVHVTMPRNIVNLGDKGNKLQTNLDVLSSFATIGVMEGLEKKALETDIPSLPTAE